MTNSINSSTSSTTGNATFIYGLKMMETDKEPSGTVYSCTCLSQMELFAQHLIGEVRIGLEAEADFVARFDVFKLFHLNL